PNEWHKDLENRPNRMIEHFPTDKPLCTVCKNVSFSEIAYKGARVPHHKTFTALENCAEDCPFCALIYNSIQRRGAFAADTDSPIWLIRTKSPRTKPARMTGIK